MQELRDFRKKLLSYPLLLEGVPVAYQLGIPRLHVEHGQLCASFFPHKVTVRGEQWEWSLPAFRLTCLYPSCKIVYFANLKYEACTCNREPESPLCARICDSEPYMRSLEAQCSRALLAWTQHRTAADILHFEKVRRQTAETLGLSALWGE